MQTSVSYSSPYQLDIEEILGRLQSDWALIEELSAILLAETPGMLDRIRKAVDAGDANELHRAAHYLKGSVGVFGQGRHTELAFGLEQAGRANKMEDADAMFGELEKCMSEMTAAVRVLKEQAHDRADS